MEKTMPRFEVFEDVAGQFRWRLIAGNGEIVATSEAYTARWNASRSARRVKEIAGLALFKDDSASNLVNLFLKNRLKR